MSGASRTDQLLQHILIPKVLPKSSILTGTTQWDLKADLSNLRYIDAESVNVINARVQNAEFGEENGTLFIGLGANQGANEGQIPNTNMVGSTGLGVRVANIGCNVTNDVFVGFEVGSQATNVDSSVVIGMHAGTYMCNVSGSVYIGALAGSNIASAARKDYNLAMGFSVARTGTGSDNVYLGAFSAVSNVGSSNVFVGYRAGQTLSSTTGELVITNTSNLNQALIHGKFAGNSTDGQGHVGINKYPLSTYNLDVSGSTNITGLLTARSGLEVTGNTLLFGDLDVTGHALVNGPFYALGNASFYGNVGISGNTSIAGNLGVSGNTLLGGNLGVAGNTTLSGSLSVASNATFLGSVGVSGGFTVGGTTTLCGNLVVTGTISGGGGASVSDIYTNLTIHSNYSLILCNTADASRVGKLGGNSPWYLSNAGDFGINCNAPICALDVSGAIHAGGGALIETGLSVSADSLFSGQVGILSNLGVQGDLVVTGGGTINNDDATNNRIGGVNLSGGTVFGEFRSKFLWQKSLTVSYNTPYNFYMTTNGNSGSPVLPAGQYIIYVDSIYANHTMSALFLWDGSTRMMGGGSYILPQLIDLTQTVQYMVPIPGGGGFFFRIYTPTGSVLTYDISVYCYRIALGL